MNVSLVFLDWMEEGKSIYCSEEGNFLSKNDFHSGTVFNCEIILDPYEEQELRNALARGYQPCFWVSGESKR